MFLTETRTDFTTRDGFTVFGTHPGQYFEENERKVGIWSKFPLRDIDQTRHSNLPGHRFVSALADTPLGPIRIVCICIPWHMANVRNKTLKKKPWQSHIEFLNYLPDIIRVYNEPVIIVGDFNQRIPHVKYGNKTAAKALQSCFAPFDIVTKGTIDGLERPGIDHIALSSDLEAISVFGWNNIVDGRRLSDHDGAGCDIRKR